MPMAQRVAVDIVFPLVRTITYKATIMSNIIRNGDFSAGLSDWKANHGVDTVTDGGRHYARLDKGVSITQGLTGLTGGASWRLRFEVAEQPVRAMLWHGSWEPVSLESLANDSRPPMLSALMALRLFDGTSYWTSLREFSVYSSWGMAANVFEVPEKFDSGEVVIELRNLPDQSDRVMGIRDIELVKLDEPVKR
jgi:hypothetical protein